jgi:hypothetical protein
MQAIITAERADNAGIIACRAVEDACLTMLEAARRDDWERVACLQAATEPMIADARRSADQALTPQQRREKLAIMRRIVLLDGEIRRLREPWQGGLERLFAPRPAADRRQALAR